MNSDSQKLVWVVCYSSKFDVLLGSLLGSNSEVPFEIVKVSDSRGSQFTKVSSAFGDAFLTLNHWWFLA